MIRLNITNKIVLLAVGASLILAIIISAVFGVIINKDQERQVQQLEKLLLKDYDSKIKHHSNIILSIVEGIDNIGGEFGLSEDSAKLLASKLIREVKYGEVGYFWADKSDGQNVFLKGSKTEGTMRWDIVDAKGNKLVQNIIKAAINGDGFSEYWWPKANTTEPLPKRSFSAYYEPYDWVIGTGNYIDDIDAVLNEQKEASQKALKKVLILQIGVALGLALLIIIVSIIIGRRLSRPIVNLVANAETIGEGNIDTKFVANSKDEIGQLANALNRMLDKLRDVINKISEGSANILQTSVELSTESEQLSQGANEQASSIEEVSSTMEEISANIEQNTMNAQQTETVSTEANNSIKEVAEKSDKAVQANKEIADKITIINDIAFQTNLLALNAAVEAARAGEHGKGFAVVAAEVRKLAENSKKAAEEIVSLAQSGLQFSQEAGEVMLRTIPKIDDTSKLIQEIASASTEQNNGAGQVNSAIQQLNSVTQQNASSSEKLAANAMELSNQAEKLREVISFFNSKNDRAASNPLLKKQQQSRSQSTNKTFTKTTISSPIQPVNIKLTDKTDDEFTTF